MSFSKTQLDTPKNLGDTVMIGYTKEHMEAEGGYSGDHDLFDVVTVGKSQAGFFKSKEEADRGSTWIDDKAAVLVTEFKDVAEWDEGDQVVCTHSNASYWTKGEDYFVDEDGNVIDNDGDPWELDELQCSCSKFVLVGTPKSTFKSLGNMSDDEIGAILLAKFQGDTLLHWGLSEWTKMDEDEELRKDGKYKVLTDDMIAADNAFKDAQTRRDEAAEALVTARGEAESATTWLMRASSARHELWGKVA